MKKIILLLISMVILTLNSSSQPQWKFHIAFEDATGARDTIWLIWDTTATGGSLALGQYDTLLNEGPFTFDYNSFNVFITSENSDTTKTWAYPYYYKTISVEIKAFNYEYPITISWDSSLFNPSVLPLLEGSYFTAAFGNDYFFLVNNDPMSQYYNMLLNNSVVAPAFNWGSQSQFPLYTGVSREVGSIGISHTSVNDNEITCYPNPSNGNFNININQQGNYQLKIYNSLGQLILQSAVGMGNTSINLQNKKISSGLYFIEISNKQQRLKIEKMLVASE
jgi:hypothetical protein